MDSSRTRRNSGKIGSSTATVEPRSITVSTASDSPCMPPLVMTIRAGSTPSRRAIQLRSPSKPVADEYCRAAVAAARFDQSSAEARAMSGTGSASGAGMPPSSRVLSGRGAMSVWSPKPRGSVRDRASELTGGTAVTAIVMGRAPGE